ncbi:F-type H+-transporting ATPase subunit gamma [Streptomyces sp. 2224.1]|uniref:F0F1 ATP synthase subunit gamma n=1 Tax=unclassified Streptomyces TaxID=2593676 RepID=UPI000883376D|nr:MULTISPECIES: F0F1 ATP synthase subunit gamma [unclassified Streptomyces]PBC85084.1 F-type H+-transporting ATPase subunit gamma [Streptomyces sp. 2321.6]SDR22257.1 F-type H+-transporting ATPase subunit gamma [Streptomyces sp. KS_16]SEB54525.1 F-type H+-transporting ATPase subunit gamma [Streptomyces sp. 2224.1]SED55242.1 F-type H+-transporting ATPase subunit gamma [Streptomyces sp. 2133.1]SNC71107.1 F-type H+-transporting ATPase subunit gamma [Streptomyces sp. 2114.4]
MGAKLRVYKRRIRSVTATKKITKAMEMIAASRVVKAQRQVAASTPYASELTRAVTAVATGSNTQHPLTTEAERPSRAALLLITSDRGLAGGYSSNVLKAGEQLTERLKAEGKEVDAYIVGRKGVSYYSFRERKVVESWTGFTDNPTYADAKAIAAPLIDAVQQDTAEGGVDELHIVYTEFISMMTQTALDDRLLPLSLDKAVAESEESAKGEILPLFEFEPSAEDVLDALLPRYVESRIYNALLQAAASKHAATRRAMKSATDNAEELIKSLSRLANAARQAEITQEISEIVGGASALADATAGSD